jgi:uncharacterized membrane protein YphA (DoxX/SURF4 family)
MRTVSVVHRQLTPLRAMLAVYRTMQFLRYLAWGALAAGAVVALSRYGESLFPAAVVSGVAVSLGAVLAVAVALVAALSLCIHLRLADAARHDAKYSFIIMLRSVVATKVSQR